jgi:imidazolonepropionase-like amidohydrolase
MKSTVLSRLALCAMLGASPARAQTGPSASLAEVPPQTGVTAFVDVSVIPMDRERVLEHQTVVVRDGRIAALGPAAGTAVPAGAVRIDGRGRFLLPGLIDIHAHFAPGNEELGQSAGRQLALYVATGFTTVRGLGGPASALQLRDRIARGEVLGPRLVVAAPSLNGQSVATPADAVRLVNQARASGYDLIKTHGNFGSAASYDSMVAAAARAGLPLVGHVTPEFGLARAMAAGQQIEHLDGYLSALLPDSLARAADAAGQVVLDPALLGRITPQAIRAIAQATARQHIWNGPTLSLFSTLVSDESSAQLALRPEMRYVPPPALQQYARQRDPVAAGPAEGRHLFDGIRNQLVLELYRAGARLLAGSDSPQLFQTAGFGALREIDAFVTAGLPPWAALETATRNPAEYLGQAAEIGTVAVGKRADLVLLDANPLESTANLRRIAGTMLAGRWVPRERIGALLEAVAARAAAVTPPPP